MSDLWDPSEAPPYERLARMEGQSNFLSLLAGVESGPDTTQDMAALAISRSAGAVPEMLEAYAAQSGLYSRPLMSMVFNAIRDELKPKERDYPWMQGAVADAFILIRYGHCKPVALRALSFRVDNAVYRVIRKMAFAIMHEMVDEAIRRFTIARCASGARGNRNGKPPGSRHTENERGDISRRVDHQGTGCRVVPRLPDMDSEHAARFADFGGRATGVRDRLAWDDRNAAPSGIIEFKPGALPA